MKTKLNERITASETTVVNTKQELREAKKLLAHMGQFFEVYGISLSTSKLDQHISYLEGIIREEIANIKKAKKALKKLEEAEALIGEAE